MDEPPRYLQSSRKFARAQRRSMSSAEAMLWNVLRDHRLDGHKFRRQVPIGPFFADFACLAKRLVVEADGRTHENDEAVASDRARDLWFEREGYRTLRFSNDFIVGGLPPVIERIRAALSG
jgi:very-short-patch-repair endonuclease